MLDKRERGDLVEKTQPSRLEPPRPARTATEERRRAAPGKSRLARFGGYLGAAVAGSTVVLACVWVFAPAPESTVDVAFTTVTAAEGTVQSQLRLDVVSHWVNVPAAVNQAKGIVTGTDPAPTRPKQVGDVLYTVGLRPVVIAEGNVPAFRDLGEGDEGADVALVQAFLASKEFFAGEQNGKFGYDTKAAVQAWQKSLEITVDGRVHLGDIVFVDVLPSVITADPKVISRGMPLIGGEAALSLRSAKPEFSIGLSKKQRDQVKAGQVVDIEHDGGLWKAAIAEVMPDPDQNGDGSTATLKPTSGDSICANECASISATGPSSFRGKVTLQEPVAGIVLPSAALVTDKSGKTQVVREDGLIVEVEILGSANGQTVVKGIDAGQVIRAPGKPSTSADQ